MILFSLLKNNKGACLISLFIILNLSSSSCTRKAETEKIPFHSQMNAQFKSDINLAISFLDSAKSNMATIKKNYRESRRHFKKIEPILSSLDAENYSFLNQPNILKIEEEDYTDIKIKNPSGYQVLEEEIFSEVMDTTSVTKSINLISSRLKLIKENTSFNHLKTYHFLWLLRKSIVRIALTGVTGFDSPVLENSLEESKVVYSSLKKYLLIFKSEFQDISVFESWANEIDQSIADLSGDFDTFDRYLFIKDHTHKQLVLWNETVDDWNVKFPFELSIKNNATSLFSSNTFNIDYFSDRNLGKTTQEKIALGKKLFYDSSLSLDKKINCGTCHIAEKAFTDGRKIATGIKRNSPTLLYAALQKAFFYDKRAGSLEGQIISVIENENEFHTNLKALERAIKKNSSYIKDFNISYPGKEITNINIRNAIASYIRSLNPFNSKFDKNINDIENSLTQSEINGFNLFSGKAKCATCHFAPVFNGTVPPDYKDSEIELIGVPEKNDTINATISKDLGRYYVYKTPERKHFFKTSTIRNADKTAPYMHNGVYNTLAQVLDFYNRGGGSGIGIHQENQTLPTDPLHLTQQEINDIIAFVKSLNDLEY